MTSWLRGPSVTAVPSASVNALPIAAVSCWGPVVEARRCGPESSQEEPIVIPFRTVDDVSEDARSERAPQRRILISAPMTGALAGERAQQFVVNLVRIPTEQYQLFFAVAAGASLNRSSTRNAAEDSADDGHRRLEAVAVLAGHG